MQAGRPLLVVPEAATGWTCAACWSRGRTPPEARRAVGDALPLLRKAREVTIVEILEDETTARRRWRGSGTSWPGCRVMASAASAGARSRGDAAAQLERSPATSAPAWSLPALMVIRGCRELILGGVTESGQSIEPAASCCRTEIELDQRRWQRRDCEDESHHLSRIRMYSFLEQIVADYMTRNVKTVTRELTTARARRDVRKRRFQHLSGRGRRAGGRHRHQVRHPEVFRLYARPDDAALRRSDEPHGRRHHDPGIHLCSGRTPG